MWLESTQRAVKGRHLGISARWRQSAWQLTLYRNKPKKAHQHSARGIIESGIEQHNAARIKASARHGALS